MLYLITFINNHFLKIKIMHDLLKNILLDYFKQNQKTKDVLMMTKSETDELCNSVASFCANHETLKSALLNEINTTLSVADFYDAQTAALATCAKESVKPMPEEKKPVVRRGRKPKAQKTETVVKPKRGRKETLCVDCALFTKESDIPKRVNRENVYKVYTRKHGNHLNPMYGVIDSRMSLQTARNSLKKSYAIYVETNYLNVSMCKIKGGKPKSSSKHSIFYI